MCEFVSWIRMDDRAVFLTDDDLNSSRGKKMRKEIMRDCRGHGAIRHYYDIPDNVGLDIECNNLSSPGFLPKVIVEAFMAGKLKKVAGNSYNLSQALTTKARYEFEDFHELAHEEFMKVAEKEVSKKKRAINRIDLKFNLAVGEQLLCPDNIPEDEYARVHQQLTIEKNNAKVAEWERFHEVCDRISAEYEQRCSDKFWELWGDKLNRNEAWRAVA